MAICRQSFKLGVITNCLKMRLDRRFLPSGETYKKGRSFQFQSRVHCHLRQDWSPVHRFPAASEKQGMQGRACPAVLPSASLYILYDHAGRGSLSVFCRARLTRINFLIAAIIPSGSTGDGILDVFEYFKFSPFMTYVKGFTRRYKRTDSLSVGI